MSSKGSAHSDRKHKSFHHDTDIKSNFSKGHYGKSDLFSQKSNGDPESSNSSSNRHRYRDGVHDRDRDRDRDHDHDRYWHRDYEQSRKRNLSNRNHSRKKSRSPSPISMKHSYRDHHQKSERQKIRPTHFSQKQKETEEQRTKKWVAEEDSFVLKQMKYGALLRIKEGRSKPIDWIAANLRLIDGDPKVYDADFNNDDIDFDIPIPYSIIYGLNLQNIITLEEDVQKYIELDRHPRNTEFWEMVLILCQDRKKILENMALNEKLKGGANPEDDLVRPVSDDINAVLDGKTYSQLVDLEKEVEIMKISKDPSVDIDFWERLLRELVICKAKAKIDQFYKAVIDERLKQLRKQQHTEALRAKIQISQLLSQGVRHSAKSINYSSSMDTISPADQANNHMFLAQFINQDGVQIQRIQFANFIENLEKNRDLVKQQRFIPMKTRPKDSQSRHIVSEFNEEKKLAFMPPVVTKTQTTYDADGVQMNENEEMFNSEENMVPLENNGVYGSDSGLQKPRFYNRVILGYEWNRYNQTHYSAESPPPKVVQGYKFNIFYPDLIDSKQAPTFSIIRDKRKTSKQLAIAAGQNDTCIIKFHSGAPYQDIAFKIVDRQWDNSPHRGSRCKFENGVLQVHFKFKRVFYRK
ncbi:uncharacterized protein SAPINGB_P003071 [Magnusiomyces paraingens]|uniref:Splicing factor Cactin n=1 Tax=Magnusiomyces paraingens TaxID=2606893 RepID=A0A5E8BRK2_9ASCO|nr:uncharacterized protein SAPINGB_P003071 [Saprochaete ingens]VVT51363.1 unnamed protein product [Saprochaete ingens]